jgi:hypothetical protein
MVDTSFLIIVTGEILVRRKWVELPIPNEVILKLEEFSTDSNDDINMILINDVEGEEDIPIIEDIEVEPENPPMVLESEDATGNSMKENDVFTDNIVEEENRSDDAIIEDEHEIVMNEMEVTSNNNKENEVLLNDDEGNEELGLRKPTGNRYNLRPNRELSYNHKYSFWLVHGILTNGKRGPRKLYVKSYECLKRKVYLKKLRIQRNNKRKRLSRFIVL